LSPNLAIEFSSALPPQGPPPGLGEHTRAVLTEAGFDPREIESLAERRIIECLHRQKNSA
jgi:crotonobetainyl-CoA:carnitine CoA-transferase CaiB-like acyl-CoA transferase